MLNPFRAALAAFRDLFDEFFVLAMANVLWCLLSAPFLLVALSALNFGAPLIAGGALLLSVLTAGPATASLFALTYRISDGRAVKIGEFFGGLRAHARQGWLIYGLWMLGLVAALANLLFYLGVANLFGGIMIGLWIYLLLLWMMIGIYVFPLIFLQERPALRLIARNALLMAMRHPIYSVATVLLMGVIFAVSAYLAVPFFLISVALLAQWSTRATRTLIEHEQARREQAAPAEPPVEEKGRKGQVRPK